MSDELTDRPPRIHSMQASNRLNHVILSLIDYKFYWILPLALGVFASAFYALFLHTPTYTARQSLIVRDDLMGTAFKPSRFESLDSMKSAQETILDIARKPDLIRNVMEQLGNESFFGSAGISEVDIEEMQGNIEFGAPNGAEFGRTEAVVLRVTCESRDRAKKFTGLLLDQIDNKLSDVRRRRLKSMEKELTLASDEALKLLRKASKQLQAKEREFGAELTTMRGLNDPQGGNTFDLKLDQIRLEKRQAIAALASAQEQKQLLIMAQENGGLEVVTSSQLLELQPGLRLMLQSLTNAREKLSIDEGRYRSLHPALKASREAVRHQKEMLVNSLGTMIAGVESQIAIAEKQVDRLDESIVQLEDRLIGLTDQRVGYDTLQDEFKNKSKVYSDVQSRLSQVQSYASSSENVALLNRIGEPQVGTRPNGLGKKAMIMAGGFLGLLAGLGLVALVVPPSGPTDYLADSVLQKTPVPVESPVVKRPVAAAESSVAATANVVSVDPVSSNTIAEDRLQSVAELEQKRRNTGLQESQQKSASGTAASKSVANTLDAGVPDSVAKHMEQLKARAASFKSEGAEKSSAPAERPSVSSADVIAAFKNAQTKPGAAGVSPAARGSASGPSSNTASTDGAMMSSKISAFGLPQPAAERKPSDAIGSIRDTLKELDASKEKQRQQAALKSSNQESARPDIVVTTDRKRSPDVPDSVAAGRITAESLIESSARRGKNDSAPSKPNGPIERISLPSSPIDPSILSRVKAELDDPNKQNEFSSARIPSITDYAKSLENPADTLMKRQPVEELSDPTLELERRTPNVRPVDIAKSLDEIDSVRGIVGEIRPEDATPEQSKAELRATEATVPTKPMDNSLVGLMRQSRKSDPELISKAIDVDVLPTEKEVTDSRPTVESTPTKSALRQTTGSVPIPEQIRELSDSISSFARPNESSQT